MPKRVYIETSIPSQYFNRRADAKSMARAEWTRDWWEKRRDRYELVTSIISSGELESGEHPSREEKLSLLRQARILPDHAEIPKIVRTYIENKLMPANVTGDPAHLAYASFYGCDYLLTWNCRHIANRNKEAHVKVINGRLGLVVPALVTPFDMLNMEDSV